MMSRSPSARSHIQLGTVGPGAQYFDTAPAYGNGLSEHRLGMALRTYARDSCECATAFSIYMTRMPNPDATN